MTGKSINSRNKNRNNIKLPGGIIKSVISKKKPSRSICKVTGKPLQAVPQLRSSAMKRLHKSKKRPERPFGGSLSSRATTAFFIKRAREESL
tara:strand:- start:1243 stop:1518 length:276 start_codon:yes stop_codon:yes gene_type:complete